MSLCGMLQETDTGIVDQPHKKSIYCTDYLFLFLFIGFSSYAVSVMDCFHVVTDVRAGESFGGSGKDGVQWAIFPDWQHCFEFCPVFCCCWMVIGMLFSQ